MEPPQQHGFYQPEVPFTVQGTEELVRWRRRQLRSIVVAWVAPAAAAVMTMVLVGMGLGFLTPLTILVAVLGGMAAPGLTVVFAGRYLKARRTDAYLPHMPAARIQATQRELPAGKPPPSAGRR